ncbi:MAG: hypothetical protein R6U50_07130 [Desulfobacterales bacterium]
MKIWSKGLGTMVLNMEFRHYYVEIKDGCLLIKGRIEDPVMWNFVITIEKEDIRGLANVIFKGRFLAFLGKNLHYFAVFFFEKLFRRSAYAHPERDIELPEDVYCIQSNPAS